MWKLKNADNTSITTSFTQLTYKVLYLKHFKRHPLVHTNTGCVRFWLRLREISLASSSEHSGAVCVRVNWQSQPIRNLLWSVHQSEAWSAKFVIDGRFQVFKFCKNKARRRHFEDKVEMLSHEQSLQLLVMVILISITASISAGPISGKSKR